MINKYNEYLDKIRKEVGCVCGNFKASITSTPIIYEDDTYVRNLVTTIECESCGAIKRYSE